MASLSIPGKVEPAEAALQRQDRIEKRRQRIASKIAKHKGDAADSVTTGVSSSMDILKAINTTSEPGPDRPTGELLTLADAQLGPQLEESRKELEQIIIDGNTLITNVKIAAEYRERRRGERVDESRKERLQRLEKEATESQEMYNTINENWIENVSKVLPLELYNQIQEHKKQCDSLLEKQDDEIYNLKRELEDQDIEYEQNLEMYINDIMLMGDRIDDTVDTMRKAFMEELELIEEYAVKDREQLLEENQRKWMELLKECEEQQMKSLDERKQDALQRFDRLTDLYGTVKQEVRLMKNQMQNDMRTLFVEREQLKCAIQLNMEKLDYNLSVLKKRQEENMKMKNSLKRLLLNLHERLAEKTALLKENICRGKRDSARLIKEIMRLERLNAEAKCKTLMLYSSNYKKFMDLWLFNEEECKEKLCKLLGSRRWIFEEQLGAEFIEPDLSAIENRPEEVQNYKMHGFPKCSTIVRNQAKSLSEPSNKGQNFTDMRSMIRKCDDSSDRLSGIDKSKVLDVELEGESPLLIDSVSDIEICPPADTDPVVLRQLMNQILKSVCDQTGFLIEEKLRKIMEPLVDTERGLVHINAVCQALGVKNSTEMQLLSQHMLRQSRTRQGIICTPKLTTPEPCGMLIRGTDILDSNPICNYPICPKLDSERMGKIDAILCDKPNLKRSPSSCSLVGEGGDNPSIEGEEREMQDMDDTKDSIEADNTIIQVLKQFSSDESLADVMDVVQQSKEELPRPASPALGKASEVEGINLSTEESPSGNPATTSEIKMLNDDSKRATGPTQASSPRSDQRSPYVDAAGAYPEDAGEGGYLPIMPHLRVASTSESSLQSSDSIQNARHGLDFFYVHPNDVLRALMTFCRNQHDKSKREYPSKAQICEAKITLLTFPKEEAIVNYWENFKVVVNAQRDVLWDAVQDVFLQYNVNLKVRNQYVEDVVKYYRQNLELSQILKRHMEAYHCSVPTSLRFQPVGAPTCQPVPVPSPALSVKSERRTKLQGPVAVI